MTRCLAQALCTLAALSMPTIAGGLLSVNPAIREIVSAVSAEHIANIERKLQSFGTRHIESDTQDPVQGIGAARQWIYDQFKSYSPRLQVRFDTYRVKKQGRITRDTELRNVIATLPGTVHPDHQILITAHYDSLVVHPKKGTKPPELDFDRAAAELFAPGVTDDGSGTAAVLELARVMSSRQFGNTLVFVAFAGEEEGLIGASLFAGKAKKEGTKIDAVLNNDIIGSVLSGNGSSDNTRVRVFSEEPSDSPSRELARYIREIGWRYEPSLAVDCVFRADRFMRGGDHTPLNQYGFAAVRLTAPSENYSHQHTVTDTFENTSPEYAAKVARLNAAVAASLALAPLPPGVDRVIEKGEPKGETAPRITRGKSGYDAHLEWQKENPEPDLLGYAVVMRSTTAPFWEHEVFVGNVQEYTLENVSIDDVVFGVKAVDKDGNESVVAPYVFRPRPLHKIETY
jgi:hypothetical protein